MQFVLLIYGDEAALRKLSKEEAARVHANYVAYTEAMKQAGVLVANCGLKPTAEAKTVRAPGGKASIAKGPFARTRQQLNGYFLIDVDDLDAALTWAEHCPGALQGAIEVRPVWA